MTARLTALSALCLAVLLSLALLPGGATAQLRTVVPTDTQGRPLYVAGEVLVQLKPGFAAYSLGAPAAAIARSAAPLAPGLARGGLQRISLAPGTGVADAVRTLAADSAVEYAQPDYLYYPADLTPTEAAGADWATLWAFENVGQSITPGIYSTDNPGTVDSDIDLVANTVGDDVALGAWEQDITGSGVIVAVIDTGVDYTHSELTNNMWSGSGGAACPGGGLPTAHGGCDFAGADNLLTTDGDNDPYPVNSWHGTHVAGTIAAVGNNGGIPGIAFNARIMALKAFPDDGGGAPDSALIAAIGYAAANGANIVNMSLGRGGGSSTALADAINNAIINHGVLIVAAAGNSNANNDGTGSWPANYANPANLVTPSYPSPQDGVVSVLASDQADARASFSNYGWQTVSIGAPGVNIYSTIFGRSAILTSSDDVISPSAANNCASFPNTCMTGTDFVDGFGTVDCENGAGSPACTWGVASLSTGDHAFIGDITASPTLLGYDYANSLDASIQLAGVAVPTGRPVLRYNAMWDLECGGSGVDHVSVEVTPSGGGTTTLLKAPDFNFADAATGSPCPDGAYTHSGPMARIYGGSPAEVSFDLTPFAGTTVDIRFRVVTDGSGNDSAIQGAFWMWDVTVDEQSLSYSAAYKLSNGTSMASPVTAGVAALAWEAMAGPTPAAAKQRLLASGDIVDSLHCLVSSGKRVNAAKAVAGTDTGSVDNSACPVVAPGSGGGSSSGGGCLVTYLTRDWLPDGKLDPLRQVRDWLWQRGDTGRALVRFYYRASAEVIDWMESTRADVDATAGL